MPLLILEGPDGSGKTTLANKLLKGTGCPTLLVKRSGPPGSVETLKFQADWIKAQGSSGLNIIADRHPLISETIYAPIVRKVSPLWSEVDALAYFGQIPDSARPLIIYCRAPLQIMAVSAKIEPQMEGVLSEYTSLVAAYDDFMVRLARRDYAVHRYDFSEDGEAKHPIGLAGELFEDIP